MVLMVLGTEWYWMVLDGSDYWMVLDGTNGTEY